MKTWSDTKRARRTAHKLRMIERRKTYNELFVPPSWTRANVGKLHPDYGLHPQQHWANKNERRANQG